MTDLSTPPAPPEAAPTVAKTYNIRGIPVELLDRYWKYATPYLKRALDRATGELTLADMLSFARAGQVQLWLVHDGARICGAATTEVIKFPTCNRLRVLTVSGTHFDLWAPALDIKLQEWALTHRCDGIEAYVRKGFVPKLRALDYQHKISQVWKPLPAKGNTS